MKHLLCIIYVILAVPWATAAQPCERIIPLAPSMAEVVYALGLGSKVLAVPAFTSYPDEAQKKPKIGALVDLNYELIVSLRPTIVLALSEFRERIEQLRSLGLRVETFEHRSLAGIMKSITQVGELCGVSERANELSTKLSAEIKSISEQYGGKKLKRVLVVVAEESGSGGAKSYFLSGTDGYFSDVLKMVQGKNVVETATYGHPSLSAEGILALDPDNIIEILPVDDNSEAVRRALAQWNAIPGLRASREGQVHIFTKDYHTIPGPRFIELAKDLARALHAPRPLNE